MIPSRLSNVYHFGATEATGSRRRREAGGWIEASPPDIEFDGGTDGYYDSIFDGPGKVGGRGRRLSLLSLLSLVICVLGLEGTISMKTHCLRTRDIAHLRRLLVRRIRMSR